MKIKFGNTGSGDIAEVTEVSKFHDAILLYNKSISDHKFVVNKQDIDALIIALQTLKEELLNG